MSRRQSSVDRASLLILAAAVTAGGGALGSVTAQEVPVPPRPAAGEPKPTAEPPLLQLRGRQQQVQHDISPLTDALSEVLQTNDEGALRPRPRLAVNGESGEGKVAGAGGEEVVNNAADLAAIPDSFHGIDLDALGDLVVPIDDDHMAPASRQDDANDDRTGERHLNVLREMTDLHVDTAEEISDNSSKHGGYSRDSTTTGTAIEGDDYDSSLVTNYIVNGKRDRLSSFVMALDFRGGTSYRGACGATMISKRYAVTAAHVSQVKSSPMPPSHLENSFLIV